MADKRIIELEERLTLSDGDYFATDNTNGTCKVNAKILLDRLSDDEAAIATKAAKVDLTNISITGSTNNTGSTIASGTFFYKDGTLVRAKTDIANNATLTLNTNYEVVTAGGLNALNDALNAQHRRKRKSISANDLRACITNDGVDLSIKDITIGDYITINSNYKAVVADIDTFYGGYDSYAVVNSHHIAMLIVGTAGSVTQKWNSSDTTSSGYNGSALHTALKNLISTIEGTLGTLISHQKLLTTATSNWAWQASQKISALTESQIYGAPIWSIDGYQQGEAWKQLEIFRKFSFNEIFGNQSVWLRSIRSASGACHAGSNGGASATGASTAVGVVGLVLFH